MAVLRVGKTALASGTILRIVDMGVGISPRYLFEVSSGQDAMGVDRWVSAQQFSVEDVTDILLKIGFLVP